MVIKSFKESFILSYRGFKKILILNLISVLPVYIFLILANRFLLDTVFISKKGLVVISHKDIEESVWIILSQKTEDTCIIGVTEYHKKYLTDKIKENKIQGLDERGYLFLDTASEEKRDNIAIKYNGSSIYMDIKYLKTGSTVSFKVRPQRMRVTISIFTISLFLFFIFSSMLLPISAATRNIGSKNLATLRKIIQLNKTYMFKSILINLIYFLIFIISLININYLKNYSNIFLAFPLVINFWILVFSFISSIWAFPIASHFKEDNVLIIIKKAFLITFDNPLDSVLLIFLIMVLTISAVLILTFTLGLFSAVILLVFPGIAGILMLFNICFKHIMEKY